MKRLSVAIAILLCTTTCAYAAPATMSTDLDTPAFQQARIFSFSDVPSTHWAVEPIMAVTRDHLMSGYSDGTFKPNKPLTREEAAALFSKIMGSDQPVLLASSFSDITSDRWSAVAIEAVAQKNIISGYGDNTYQPDKYMSRQEFAVVADNYIHYEGYRTEDPTILDEYAFADQKFVAPWAQDAVRELASLGMLMYDKHSMFNPEKYVTRAEAASLAYRLTSAPQAEQFRLLLFQQQTERKAVNLIDTALGYKGDFDKFRHAGAMYWNNGTLHIAVKKEKDLKRIGSALAMAHDATFTDAVHAHEGKYTQAYFDELQLNATYAYHKLEPKGHVISVVPDAPGNLLIITVDQASNETIQLFNKQFNKKATLAVAEPTDTTTVRIPANRFGL